MTKIDRGFWDLIALDRVGSLAIITVKGRLRMNKAVTAQLIGIVVCTCAAVTFLQGQITSRCCMEGTVCPWGLTDNLEPRRCDDKGEPLCVELIKQLDSHSERDDSPTCDPGCHATCCKVCQSLLFLPSNCYKLSFTGAAQSWACTHSEPALTDYLRTIYRPPRS